MARWRKEISREIVHLVADDVNVSLCGIHHEHLGVTISDPPDVRMELCATCSRGLAAAADIAIDACARVMTQAQFTDAEGALIGLARLTPAGPTQDPVVFALACLARHDSRRAHDELLRWRNDMRRLGIILERR